MWKETILPGIIQTFQMGNIFNVNETGLLWKLLPERTLQFKGMDCKGGKHAKDKTTILAGDGTLMVSKNPKNHRIIQERSVLP